MKIRIPRTTLEISDHELLRERRALLNLVIPFANQVPKHLGEAFYYFRGILRCFENLTRIQIRLIYLRWKGMLQIRHVS